MELKLAHKKSTWACTQAGLTLTNKYEGKELPRLIPGFLVSAPANCESYANSPRVCLRQDGMEFMMSATQQGLSRTANYYISTSPALETSKESVSAGSDNTGDTHP